MAHAVKVLPLKVDQAAYLAGLIDGEGTVTLTRMHARESRRLVVSISNNDASLLAFVRSVVGAGRITTKRTYSQHHALSFTYQISSRQALDLLQQVVPFLRTYKRRRALLALVNYVKLTPRNGRYTQAQGESRREFERQLLAMKG